MTSVGSRHESKFQGKYSSRAHHFMGLLLVVVLAFAGVIFTEEKAESSASLLTPQGNILSIVSGSDDSSQLFSLTDVFEHGVGEFDAGGPALAIEEFVLH